MVLCLQWENHQATVIKSIITIYESHLLLDCTVSAEGRSVRAHKIILAAASPFFQEIFKVDPGKEDFILETVMYEDLKSIIDFIYNGSVELQPEKRASFLELATFLRIPVLVSNPLVSNARESTDHDSKDIGLETVATPSGSECQTNSTEDQFLEQSSIKKEENETGIETKEIFHEVSIQFTEKTLSESTTDPLAITSQNGFTCEVTIKPEKKEIPDTDPLNDEDSETESRRPASATGNYVENDNVIMGRDSLDVPNLKNLGSVAKADCSPGSPSSITSQVTLLCSVGTGKDILVEVSDNELSEDSSPKSPDNVNSEDVFPPSPNSVTSANTCPRSPDGVTSANTCPRSPDGVSSANTCPRSPNSVNSKDTSSETSNSVSSTNIPPRSPHSVKSIDTFPESPSSVSSATTFPRSPDSVRSTDMSSLSPNSVSNTNSSKRPSSTSSKDLSSEIVSSERTSHKSPVGVSSKDVSDVEKCLTSPASVSSDVPLAKLIHVPNVKCDNSNKKKVVSSKEASLKRHNTEGEDNSRGEVVGTETGIVPSIGANQDAVNNLSHVRVWLKRIEPESVGRFVKSVGSVSQPHTSTARCGEGKNVACNSPGGDSSRAESNVTRSGLSDQKDSGSNKECVLKRLDSWDSQRQPSSAERDVLQSRTRDNTIVPSLFMTRKRAREYRELMIERLRKKIRKKVRKEERVEKRKKALKTNIYDIKVILTRIDDQPNSKVSVPKFQAVRKLFPQINSESSNEALCSLKKKTKPSYQCALCSFSSKLFPSLERHLHKAHSRKKVDAAGGRKKSRKRRTSLVNSRKESEQGEKKILKCKKCGKRVPTKIAKSPVSSSLSLKKSPLNLTLRCKNHLDYLKQYIETHPYQTPYRCRKCGLEYKCLDQVRRSLGIKPFCKCLFC